MSLVATPQETFLGLEEAAQALQCSADHLGELAAAGTVPAVKVGRAWVFLASDLVAYCRAQQGKAQQCESTKSVRSGTRTSVGSKASLELVGLLGAPKTSPKNRRGSKPTGSQPVSSLSVLP